MTQIRLIKKFGKLVPYDEQSKEYVDSLPVDGFVTCDIKRPRNSKHHRKYFALLNTVYNAQDVYESFEAFRSAMACAVGYADTTVLPDGRTVLVAKSISFAKMDQDAFNEFWKANIKVICTKILPGVTEHDLESEILEFMG